MKFLTNTLRAFTLSAACLLGSAQAALLSIETDKNSYQVGDTVTSRLYFSDFNGPLTGAYLALLHDKAGLSLNSWQLADMFDDGLGAYSFADYLAADGKLFLESYADWAADLSVLLAKQGSKFLFATVSWTVGSAGFYQFGLDSDYQGVLDSQGLLGGLQLQSNGFSVTGAEVPAPATLLLMLPLLAVLRRRAGNQR
jgi:hypothetical protein